MRYEWKARGGTSGPRAGNVRPTPKYFTVTYVELATTTSIAFANIVTSHAYLHEPVSRAHFVELTFRCLRVLPLLKHLSQQYFNIL